MRGLNAGYAQYFSRKYNRRGYLFQDRYRSQVTQDQLYVEKIIRYIHLNPVRAGICKNILALNRYRWSGHSALAGTVQNGFQDTATVLKRFGKTIESGRRGYLNFVREGISIKDKFSSSTDVLNPSSYVIGDPDFVKSAIDHGTARRARIARFRLENVTVEDIAQRFVAAAGITINDLRRRGRGSGRSELRRLFSYVCHKMYDIPITEIAQFLEISHSPASVSVRIGEEIANDRRYLKVLTALRP